MNRHFVDGRLTVAAVIASLAATAAAAQTTESATAPPAVDSKRSASAGETSSDTLGEVVVTARYRQERLQDIGLSASVISGEDLATVTQLADIAARTPGLNIADRGPNKSNVSFRGMANLSPAYNWQRSTAAVGMYLDDVSVVTPFSTQRSWNLFDVSRVEIVRGPQGTLYGEGAMGGAIRYIVADPSLTQVEGRAAITGSQYENGDGNNWRADATVSLPLVRDKASVRLTAFKQDDAGFIDYTIPGVDGGNTYRSTGGRIVVLGLPTDRLRLRASATYEDAKLGSEWTVTGNADDLQNTNNFALEPQHDKALIVSVRADYELGYGTVSSITGYWDRQREDLGLEPNLSLGLGFPATKNFAMNDEGVSEELRFVGAPVGKADYTVVGYYKSSRQEFRGQEFSAVPGLPGIALDEFEKYSGTHFAVSGEVRYAWTDRLKTTLGVRYFQEEVDADQVWTEPEVLFNGVPSAAFQTELSISKVLPKVLLEYRPADNALLYATAARGARNGNLNITSTVVLSSAVGTPLPRSANADSAWSYEVGAKTSWLDRRLTANIAAYYIKWKDLQAEAGSPPIPIGAAFSSLPYNANVGTARSLGAEIALLWQPNKNVGAELSAGYTDAKLENSFLLNSINGSTVPEDAKIPFTPEYKVATGLFGKLWLNESTVLTGRADYQYTGSQITGLVSEPVNVAIIPVVDVASYGLLNLRTGLEFPRWSVTAFVDNATSRNVGVATSGSSAATGINYFVIRPRTAGLTVNVSF